jgi:hypothetical protein
MQQLKASKTTVLLHPQTITHGSTTTANFDLLDVKGEAEILVTFGAMAGAGTVNSSIKISESDDTEASNFVEIAALASTAGAIGTNQHGRFFINRANGSRKRYAQIAITLPTSGTNSNILVAATGRVYEQGEDPSADSEMGATVVKEAL